MLLSEHIAACQRLLAEHGDHPVFYREVDPHTGASSEEDPDVEFREEWVKPQRSGPDKVYPDRFLIRY